MPFQCSPRKIQLFVLVLAAVTIVSILMVLFLFNYPAFARNRVIDQMTFKNGTMEFERFETTADLKNLRLVFYIFNVTNAKDVVENSAKIKVQELGPYVYHEYKYKEIIDNNQTTGLITFKLRKRYTLLRHLSVGDPTKDMVTWPNVPVVVLQTFVEQIPWIARGTIQLLLNKMIADQKEQAFINDTVENFLFDGSHRQFFENLQKLTQLTKFKIFDPWPLKDNNFAILYDKNDTWIPGRDYLFTVSAGSGGNQTYHDLNQYVYQNGSSTLSFWNPQPPSCNQLHGTDGEFFSPFLDKNQSLQVYTMDLCRKLNFQYRQTTSISGIQVYKYTLDPTSLQSGQKNAANQCYCLQRTSTGAPSLECSLDGLIDLSTCISPTIIGSGSHFIHGSSELLNRVDGLRLPNATLDEPYLYIEPNTGLTIQVKTPIQMNVRMQRGGLKLFNFLNNNDSSLILPILTVAESAEMLDDQASLLRSKLLLLDSWLICTVLGGTIVFVISIIVVGSVLCIRRRDLRLAQSESLLPPSETDPLIPRSTNRVDTEVEQSQPQQDRNPQNYMSV